MLTTKKLTRKFNDKSYYSETISQYFLLPFRFLKINESHEVLVNDIGDFVLVPIGTTKKIVNKVFLKSENIDLYYDLISNFIISESEKPELLPVIEARYRTKKSFLDNFTSLHIFVVTLRCEHTCHYCQVSRVTENKDQFDMSFSNIDEGISLMMQSPNQHVTMEFQGGEALLAFDKIEYAVNVVMEKAKEYNKKVTFVICTNLAPITDKMIDFIKKNDILISTSLDGPEFIHNKNRRRPGNNSYEITIDGINKCKAKLGNDKVSALMTTTALSLQYPEEIIDEYIKQGFENVFLRPISPYGFAKYNPKKNHYFIEEFLDFYKKGLNYILELNKNGQYIVEDYASIILKKIFTPFPVGYVDLQSPAGLINSVIVFNYDGYIYATDEARMLAENKDYSFQLGKLGINSYNEIFYGDLSLQISDVFSNESLAGCSECAFQTYCGADPVLNHATQGDMYGFRPSSIFCKKNMEIIRYLFDLMVKDKNNERIFKSWITGYNL
ncbi:His-Xaa-Ser system radical SAM maturase HxsB [Chryseobacterium sp. KMC2]|uniref:His-Xaa-Ser system radical SAM maturase HxsB n=1 Tax=Chryseobacterium sp. KMC2 TaxID=2800705 RepID=UPI001923C340|nr:His-Xaa-Ser system radical SAM maturase HxsB [Chryseobacterium sp. KMC2]MBL3546667.1 His-Xaa-Ser system radical SAM maturase HxsB [Chryseobacterium sp. KMC2]